VAVKLGDVLPADLRIMGDESDGPALKVDQAALTGESMPVAVHAGGGVFAGSVVRPGCTRISAPSAPVHKCYVRLILFCPRLFFVRLVHLLLCRLLDPVSSDCLLLLHLCTFVGPFSMVTQGEAEGIVCAIGPNTFMGRTAMLVWPRECLIVCP
jgi:magnesium-transporting ATPase (P-type)